MKKDIGVFILAAAKVLQIEKPVYLTLKTKASRKTNKWAGYCEARYRKEKLIGHYIVLNLETCLMSEYPIIDTIAHEMVHACMLEHNVHDNEKHHDKKFQNICKVLEIEMPALGWKLGPLYNPETDKD